MANAQEVPPAPFVAVLPNVSFSGPPWTGYAVATGLNVVTSVDVGYYEPSFNNYTCSSDAEGTWAGIGDYNLSHDLGQDGTAHHVSGLANHQAWYEILPNGPVPLSPVGNANDFMVAYVAHSSQGYSGFVQDVSNNEIQGWSAGGAYDGDSAEAEAEKPAGYNALSNFGTLSFEGAYYNNVIYFNNSGSRHQTIQYDPSGQPYALPGSIGSGGAFNDNWQRCT